MDKKKSKELWLEYNKLNLDLARTFEYIEYDIRNDMLERRKEIWSKIIAMKKQDEE